MEIKDKKVNEFEIFGKLQHISNDQDSLIDEFDFPPKNPSNTNKIQDDQLVKLQN